jgi:hypothetical protein
MNEMLIVKYVYFVMGFPVLQPMELFSTRPSDEAKIRITVRLVGDLKEGDYHYIQFFNILMRKALGHLQLELVGRNFFDASAKVLHLSACFGILLHCFFALLRCNRTV